MAHTARSARPARTFTVTRVEVVNTATSETTSIPGMVVTLAELRAMVACAPHTAQVYCDKCGESIADCPDTRNSVSCPFGWSYRDEVTKLRHVDGLVTFNA